MEKSVGQVLRTARQDENIGSGGTWSSRKTDGGRWLEIYPVRSLYLVDTVRTRGGTYHGHWVSRGGRYCGGLHCRQAPVLRACGRTLVTAGRLPSMVWRTPSQPFCSHWGSYDHCLSPQTTIAHYSLLREMVFAVFVLGTYGASRGFSTWYLVLRRCSYLVGAHTLRA